MRLSEARKYRAAIEKASASLSDEELLEVPNLAPLWMAGTAYEPGDRVTEQRVLYKCLQGHIGQSGWEPGAAASLWAEVLIPDENVIPEWKQPQSTNGYRKGDRVRHVGLIWESILDDNIWEPGVYGWEVVK